MKKILIFMVVFSSLLFASNHDNNDSERKSRVDEKIQKQIEKEKKYSKEQTFYTEKDYDLKGAEVDINSLGSIPVIEPEDDFNMDSVYD